MTDVASAPIVCPRERVIEDWIDYNGHLNMAYYNVIFDRGVDYFYQQLGIGEDYTRSGIGSAFTLEVHLHYLNEVALGDEVEVRLQLLDFDSKRLHFFQQMYQTEQGYLAATSEQIALHVDIATRKAGPLPQHAQTQLESVMQAHKDLTRPEQVGHRIGIQRRQDNKKDSGQ